jgi:hypothetical protein
MLQLFAGAIAAVGLGALGKFEGFVLYALQGFALLSSYGLALAVRQHRSPWSFMLGVASFVALARPFYGTFSERVRFTVICSACSPRPSGTVSCYVPQVRHA